jgi:hypothetical protein
VDGDGKPTLGGAIVVVMPADDSRRVVGARTGAMPVDERTLDYGFFAPGEYLIGHLPADASLPWGDRDRFFARFAEAASRITLGEHEDRVVEIRIGGGAENRP